jgi:hypothetical protein
MALLKEKEELRETMGMRLLVFRVVFTYAASEQPVLS